jgi:uncharacterized protein (DUF1684 family)
MLADGRRPGNLDLNAGRPALEDVVTMTRTLMLFVLCLAWAPLGGCTEGKDAKDAPGAVVMDTQALETWEIALVETRIGKNEEFTTSPQSPLPASLREGFEGLDYYFPVQELRFQVPFAAAPSAETVSLTKRKGQSVPYLRKGTVRFQHAGKVHTLAVFGPAEGDDASLWLPFYDQTNGKTTYPGGRYLDLQLAPDGTVEVDFNRAYNPLCAYNPEGFNCTLPPEENRLPFSVEAGEKLLGGKL